MSRYRGRPSKYRKSLKNNPYWKLVKRKVRIRDNFKCKVCQTTIKLETHHITYTVNGKSIIGKELEYLEWLVTLCINDHNKAHTNKQHPFNPNNPNKKTANQWPLLEQ